MSWSVFLLINKRSLSPALHVTNCIAFKVTEIRNIYCTVRLCSRLWKSVVGTSKSLSRAFCNQNSLLQSCCFASVSLVSSTASTQKLVAIWQNSGLSIRSSGFITERKSVFSACFCCTTVVMNLMCPPCIDILCPALLVCVVVRLSVKNLLCTRRQLSIT